MMKWKSSVIVALAGLVWVIAAATSEARQAPVDFSGRWVLESGSLPSASTELVVRQRSGLNSVPREVSVTRTGPSGASTETLYVGTVGGTVPGTSGGRRTSRQVSWEDSTLVIDIETLGGQPGDRAPSDLRREVWSVTPEGKLKIVITESGPSRTPQTTALIYRQVSAGFARLQYAV